MLPDRVSNPGPLTYESGTLPIALRGPASGRDTPFWDIINSFIYHVTKYYEYSLKLSNSQFHWQMMINLKCDNRSATSTHNILIT